MQSSPFFKPDGILTFEHNFFFDNLDKFKNIELNIQ